MSGPVTSLVSPGALISPEWHKTPEGREYLAGILRRNRRRIFGLLERPSLSPQQEPETVSYKIYLAGKSGVGKTATVAKLAGIEVPPTHQETPGIQTTVLYWPAKLVQREKVIMFKLHFWDAGEQALKKFDHILPACKDKVDAVLFLFSFTDRSSFDDLPHLMSRVVESSESILRLVVGTKYDQTLHNEVPTRDIREFEHRWKVPVLMIRNVDGPRTPDGKALDGRAGIMEVAQFLNSICEHLWRHDQIAAGIYRPPDYSGEPKISFI
ncbi:RSG1 [Branchiostoma lanceolatum]|uniref:Ciliogenesis and planar polarity effector 2 n=1 Tax=Branchiostoma lanceolatum TaxID=7740 RepID=A0A8J9VHT1_BRALA|nr:RSG1 [Branchiostoma lanceolatum]